MHHIEMSSILTCPKCGHVESADMPVDRPLHFYVCESCSLVITPKPGGCCVFCSYGNTPCPSAQKALPWGDSDLLSISLGKRML